MSNFCLESASSLAMVILTQKQTFDNDIDCSLTICKLNTNRPAQVEINFLFLVTQYCHFDKLCTVAFYCCLNVCIVSVAGGDCDKTNNSKLEAEKYFTMEEVHREEEHENQLTAVEVICCTSRFDFWTRTSFTHECLTFSSPIFPPKGFLPALICMKYFAIHVPVALKL